MPDAKIIKELKEAYDAAADNENNGQVEVERVDRYEEYRKELQKKGLKTRNDLKRLVRPIVRKCVKINVKRRSKPPGDSRFISHFGGQPYFDQGEQWPSNSDKRPYDFIFQIVNDGKICLPREINIFQFFCDLDGDEQYDNKVKIYLKMNRKKAIRVSRPESLNEPRFCRMDFERIKSLPDWDGIDQYQIDASSLSRVIDDEKPWEPYQRVVTQLIGKQDYQSQIGGYPQWVQGNSTPDDRRMELLMQSVGEKKAGVFWRGPGLLYFFYDPDDLENITGDKIEVVWDGL
jgi:uncharacterized protein YwqG